MRRWTPVKGIVSRGYGVASGYSGDPRFPNGTIEMQRPVFQSLGLDLTNYFMGTVNVAIAPQKYKTKSAKHTFRNVEWSPTEPAEDFSFFDCRILTGKDKRISGLVYYPHPETKPEHFQSPDTLEVMAPFISGLKYGDELTLEVDSQQLEILF